VTQSAGCFIVLKYLGQHRTISRIAPQTPADDEMAAGREINSKDVCFLVEEQY